MKMFLRQNRRALGILVSVMALGYIGLATESAGAQTPRMAGSAQPTGPKRFYNKANFRLPIQIDDRSRSMVREVVLYVKENGGPWLKKGIAKPDQRFFNYQAPRDGEYWFNVVTVDRNGKAFPADVRIEPPALVVIVDTRPPVIEITPLNIPGGKTAVRCRILDDNPDYQKVHLTLNNGGPTWQPLQRMPGSVDMYELPSGASATGTLRCVASDNAGNTNSRNVPLQANSQVAAAPQQQQRPIIPVANNNTHVQRPIFSPANSGVDLPPANPNTDMALPPFPNSATAKAPARNNALPIVPPPNPLNKEMVRTPNTLPAPVNANASQTEIGNRQLINTTNATIDYRLDKVGPSGVSKVDIWMKAENAATWQRLASDHDRKTPAEVTLPGEGVFGIRLGVTNGNGFGGQPPKAMDQPNFWIEVDQTPPFAQMQLVDPHVSGGMLNLRWTASDKNLVDSPVSLYYATQAQGPWQPIAQGISNSGQHNWQFPRNAGGQFYVRLEVTDGAGNVTRVSPPAPIVLDMTVPAATVVGVTPRSQQR